MTLKEKLELLWKYLLLAVIVFGLVQMTPKHHASMLGAECSHKSGYDMKWFGKGNHDFEDMDIEVMIEKLTDGDSTIKVIVNGETMDLDHLEDLDDNIFIKKMKSSGDGKEHGVKIIKKKVIEK